MIRGLYTAAAGMLAMQRRQETLANNLANINTAGYKQEDGVLRAFPEQLISRIKDAEGPNVDGLPTFTGGPVEVGRLHTGVYMSEAIANFKQGDIVESKNPYDLALLDNLPPVDVDGKQVKRTLFFSVARLPDPQQPVTDPTQIRYTRNGNFNVNQDGYLITPDGYYVLDNGNRAIRVNGDANGGPLISGGQQLKISPTGELLVQDPDAEDGVYVSLDPTTEPKLGLTAITDTNQLVREGNNLYRWAGQNNPPVNVADDAQLNGFYGVKQGWVERSNVDPTQTMTDMMTVLKAYEANQRVISTLDGTLEKAANDIGRVNG